ncbi:MAG: PAS domain S-box protein [Euryarchaeota archaeon]|nr:PAS domain S-box protein [Euryarchaeota archaeon]
MAGARILVVEDEAIVARDIGSRVVALGYQVAGVAHTAADAVARAGELRPDLVLMDIRLGGRTDGIEAACAIRERFDVPSVFLTAYADDETLRRARATEPFGYLVKPFQDRELHATIEMALYRHRAERALRASELRLRTLVQLAPDAIVMTDVSGGVVLWNRAAEAMFGFSEREVAGRPLSALLDAEGAGRGAAVAAELARKGGLRNLEIQVAGRSGEPVPVEMSASVLLDQRGRPAGTVSIWRDVSERRRARLEMMSRLMTHELWEGNLYLVKEAAPVLSLECFRELLRAGYRGTMLSRSPAAGAPVDGAPQFEHRWISRRGGEGSLPPDPAALERWVDGLRRNQALLIDRLDYLVSEGGFEGTLRFVHRLRELAYLHGHIVVLSVDPETLPPGELRAFEKESSEVRARSAKALPEDLLEIVRLVYQLNGTGIKPTMREICSELGLSRPTARKRLRNLVRSGHVLLGARGRTKVVELSERGRRVFLG